MDPQDDTLELLAILQCDVLASLAVESLEDLGKRGNVAKRVTQIPTLVMDCFCKRVSVCVKDCVFVLLMGV